MKIKPKQIFQGKVVRIEFHQRLIHFFEKHYFLICAAFSVKPIPVEQRYVREINGKPCETYIVWFSITFALTMTVCPIINMPYGFSSYGLPTNLQITGKPRGEAELFKLAKRLEAILGFASRLPVTPRSIE